MHPLLVATVLCVCLPVLAGPADNPATGPEIVELYPNPAAIDDHGEFVTVRVPPETNLSRYELSDGHATVPLSKPPNTDLERSSLVTFSTDVNRTLRLTNRTVAPLPDALQLANGGDTVRLLKDGVVVDEVGYDRAPESEIYDAEAETWRPLGGTDRPIVSDDGGTVEAFVLPDESERAESFLEQANDRILLAGYTLSSDAVVDTLRDAYERGVSVEVLVEGNPVGGMSAAQASALDELSRTGITVRVFSGELERYQFHHAKYAVVDGRALVTTENWKPSGTGGRASRGWGVITGETDIVDGLVETYRADAGWVDTESWEGYDDRTLVEEDGSTGDFPAEFEATELPVEESRLLVAPDNMETELLDAIEGAEDSIDIKQVRIGDRELPLLNAVLEAAGRGVDVRILLSGEWYVEEENRELKRWLEDQAEAAGLSLSVRLADPQGKYEKIHAKGLIVDGEKTFVGSANWNNNSLRDNREVGLLLEGEAVGEYYRSVFESDWNRDGSRQLPVGYLAACLAGATLAILAGSRLEFD